MLKIQGFNLSFYQSAIETKSMQNDSNFTVITYFAELNPYVLSENI